LAIVATITALLPANNPASGEVEDEMENYTKETYNAYLGDES